MKNIFLSLFSLAFILNCYSQCTPLITNGLVAFYPFCGNANDASGNANNGTVNGATLTTDHLGNANSAYSFNGISNNIDVPNSSSLQFSTNKISIGMWIYPTAYPSSSPADTMIFVSKGSGNVNNGFDCCLISNSAPSMRNGRAGGTNLSPLPLNMWSHIVFIYDNGNGYFYLNGVFVNLISGQSSIIGNNTLDLFFGRANLNTFSEPNFAGKLENIYVFNRALSPCEVFDLYNGSISPATPTINANMSTLTSSSATGNQWSLNGNPISGATSQFYNVTSNGLYSVCVTNANNCSSCSAPYNFNTTGINESISEINISVFPNPSSGIFTANFKNKAVETKICVYDVLGHCVLDKVSVYEKQKIDLSSQPNGIYFLQIKTSEESATKKIIVSH